jgi:hypothetical protein
MMGTRFNPALSQVDQMSARLRFACAPQVVAANDHAFERADGHQ